MEWSSSRNPNASLLAALRLGWTFLSKNSAVMAFDRPLSTSRHLNGRDSAADTQFVRAQTLALALSIVTPGCCT